MVINVQFILFIIEKKKDTGISFTSREHAFGNFFFPIFFQEHTGGFIGQYLGYRDHTSR